MTSHSFLDPRKVFLNVDKHRGNVTLTDTRSVGVTAHHDPMSLGILTLERSTTVTSAGVMIPIASTDVHIIKGNTIISVDVTLSR